MPGQECFGQLCHHVRIGVGDVLGFAAVFGEVVQFHLGSVVLAKQFPASTADGEIRQVAIAIKAVAIRRPPKKLMGRWIKRL